MSTSEVANTRVALDTIAERINERAEHLGFLRGMMEAARFLRMTGDRASADRLIGRAQA